MKILSIGAAGIVLLLVGSFVLNGNKKANISDTVIEAVQETPKKTYPTIRQEYSPPSQQGHAPTPQVVTKDTVSTITPPPTGISAPVVPVIPADMTPPPVVQEEVNIPAQAQQKGVMVDYTGPADLDNLTGTNILFFKASWCITCTMLHDKLKEERADIPAGVTIWVVDYDSNEAMRRAYGVTSQHTLVQIDQSKNKINLWRGGFSLSDVMSNVK